VGPYSQAIELGGTLFCSGQIAIDPKTNEVSKADVKTQAKLVMENVKAVLHHAGYDFDHVVKTTIFLTKMSDFATVNEVYATYFKPPYPARSTVAVSELPKGVQVEVEVLARK
jgi:2-iminobutanoate/2-iminopropanoate deaminase